MSTIRHLDSISISGELTANNIISVGSVTSMYGMFDTISALHINDIDWNNIADNAEVNSIVRDLSAGWTDASDNVTIWTDVYSTVSSVSTDWVQSQSIVSATSSNWSEAQSFVNSFTSDWVSFESLSSTLATNDSVSSNYLSLTGGVLAGNLIAEWIGTDSISFDPSGDYIIYKDDSLQIDAKDLFSVNVLDTSDSVRHISQSWVLSSNGNIVFGEAGFARASYCVTTFPASGTGFSLTTPNGVSHLFQYVYDDSVIEGILIPLNPATDNSLSAVVVSTVTTINSSNLFLSHYDTENDIIWIYQKISGGAGEQTNTHNLQAILSNFEGGKGGGITFSDGTTQTIAYTGVPIDVVRTQELSDAVSLSGNWNSAYHSTTALDISSVIWNETVSVFTQTSADLLFPAVLSVSSSLLITSEHLNKTILLYTDEEQKVVVLPTDGIEVNSQFRVVQYGSNKITFTGQIQETVVRSKSGNLTLNDIYSDATAIKTTEGWLLLGSLVSDI